jgi:ketosteroid isomerase-like protein
VTSQENVEVGQRIARAFNDGDLETALASMHPDIEFIPMRAPVQGAYRGHGGVREFFADNAENFDVFHVDTEETHDQGDFVVGIGKLRVRGKGSGVEVVVPTAVVLTFEQGKVVRFEEFGERAKALAAAGLAE